MQGVLQGRTESALNRKAGEALASLVNPLAPALASVGDL